MGGGELPEPEGQKERYLSPSTQISANVAARTPFSVRARDRDRDRDRDSDSDRDRDTSEQSHSSEIRDEGFPENRQLGDRQTCAVVETAQAICPISGPVGVPLLAALGSVPAPV